MIAIFVLLNAKPNLFIFHLIENMLTTNDVERSSLIIGDSGPVAR